MVGLISARVLIDGEICAPPFGNINTFCDVVSDGLGFLPLQSCLISE